MQALCISSILVNLSPHVSGFDETPFLFESSASLYKAEYDSNFLCFGEDNHLTISLQKLLTGTSVFFIKETNFGSIIL